MQKGKTTRKKKKAVTTKLSLVATVYDLVKQGSQPSQYNQQKYLEELTIYPKNANAEKIVVSQKPHAPDETSIEFYRVSGGEKYVSLSFISNNSGRTEASALSIIKAELKRFC